MVNYTNYSLYNTTQISNANGISDIFQGVNTMSGGLLGGFLLFFFFLLGYVAVKRVSQDEQIAVTTGLFTSSFIGALAWFAGWMAWQLAFIPVVLLVLMVIYMSMNKD